METIRKILIISPFARPNIGGVETHIDKLIDYLVNQKNYYPILITYQPLTCKAVGDSHEIGNGFEIFRVSWFGNGLFNKLENYFPLQFIYLFPGLFLKSLTYYIKNSKDIHCIHAHGFIAAAVSRIICLFKRTRVVVSTHAVYSLTERPILGLLVKILLNDFDRILAVSEVSKKELIQTGVNSSKVIQFKNWTDSSTFVPRDRKKAKDVLDIKNQNNLLFVGRLIEKKGIKLFLAAAENMPEVGFHIVGTGDLNNLVLDVASNHGNVHYHEVLMQSDKAQLNKLIDLYNVCDYLVSPYLYDEGFSITLIEAISCGIPVIVSKRGSPPTFLDESVAHFLTPNPDKLELINELKVLLSSPTVFNRDIVRAFAEKNFSSDNAKLITEAYEH